MEHIHSFFRTLSSGMASIGVITDATTPADIYFAIARWDDGDEVSRLIDEVGFDLGTPDAEGNTILHHAISCDRPNVISMLAQRAWETDPGVFRLPNHKGETPLIHAISMKKVALIYTLLALTPTVPFDGSIHGLEPGEHRRESLIANLMLMADGDINKALSLAVKDECPTSVEYLISAGVSTLPLLADLNAYLGWYWYGGLIRVDDVLRLLTDPGCMGGESEKVRKRLMTTDAVHGVLRHAIAQQDKQALVALRCFAEAGVSRSTLTDSLGAAILDSWEKLRIVDGDTGETLLHWAAASGVRDSAWERLVDRYDPSLLNTADEQGYTPLMLITARGDVPMMRDLIARGGRTAPGMRLRDILCGVHYEQKDAVSVKALILINARGDISRALEFAILLRQSEAAKLFVGAGALAKAAEFQTPETMDWLIERGLLDALDVFDAVAKLNCAILPRDEGVVRSLTRPEVVMHVLKRLRGHPESDIFFALKLYADAGVEEGLLAGTLSTLLDSTLEDKKFNNTLLHRAVETHLGGGTENLVRLIAKCKPTLMNAWNAKGQTPLTLAANLNKFEWIKSLVRAGGRMNDAVPIAHLFIEYGDEDFLRGRLHRDCASVLIEVNGDMEKAFEIALERGSVDQMREFLRHGSSTVSLLQRADGHLLGRLVENGLLRADDVLVVLKQAMESGNEALVSLLATPDVVMSSLPMMYEHSDRKVAQVLREFTELGIKGKDMLSCELGRFFNKKAPHSMGLLYVNSLDVLGFPAIPEILKMAPPSPLSTLGDGHARSLCNFLFRREVFAETVKKLAHIDPEYVDFLLDVAFRNAYAISTSDIAYTLENFQSLIGVGLSPSFAAFAYLVPVVQRSTGENQRLAIKLWRQSNAKSMCAAVVKGERKYVASREDQMRLRNVVRFALRYLLGRDDLSNAQKVNEISEWMKSEAASAEAGELLLEAQAKGRVATMKVLVSAGAPTEKAFLRQSELLRLGERGAQALTAKMIEWGSNVSPALDHLMTSVEAYRGRGHFLSADRAYAALRKLLVVQASVGALHLSDQAEEDYF